MPRTLSSALLAHLNTDTYTLGTCWKLTRSDGMVLGFTSHTADLTFGGVLYRSKTGVAPTTIRSTLGTGIDNLDVLAVFDDDAITEADLNAGLYREAKIEVFIVNYADLSQGQITLIRGTIGETVGASGAFTAELPSNIQRAQQLVCELTSSTCRAELGDARCLYAGTIDFTPFTITSVASSRSFAATGVTQADDFFSSGTILWLTGANAGIRSEIKRHLHSGGSIELQIGMARTVAVGDTFSLRRGCNGTFAQCQAFGNAVHFQAEPHIVGRDKMMAQPK